MRTFGSDNALTVVRVGSASLFLVLAWPLLSGQLFTLNDLAAYHIPMRHLYQQALLAGDSIFWTAGIFSGFPLFGEGQVGALHPWHLLLYRLLPLEIAINVEMLSSYVAMFSGTLLCFRRLGLAPASAWLGAMLFTFSGYHLAHLIHINAVAIMAHLPWLLLATYVLLANADRRRRYRAFIAVALLVASELFLGHPQSVWLTLLPVGFLTLYLLERGLPLRRVATLLGAGLVGILVGAVQLLSTLEVAGRSLRASWNVEGALSYSLSPWNLVQLWSPFAFVSRIHAAAGENNSPHEFFIYNGALCTIALAWVAIRWRQLSRRSQVAASLVFAGLALILALGRFAGIYTWLLYLPGMQGIRAPVRHIVLVHLVLSALAAVAIDDLLGMRRRGETLPWLRLWPLGVVVALAFGTMGATAFTGAPQLARWGVVLSPASTMAPWAAMLATTAGLVALGARGIGWATPLVIALAVVDVGWSGFSYPYFTDYSRPVMTLTALRSVAPLPPDIRRGDIIQTKRQGEVGNLSLLSDIRIWPGYAGLTPSLTLDPLDVTTHRLGGLAWHVTPGIEYERVPEPMPRARLVSSVRQSGNVAVDVHLVDIARTALVDVPLDIREGPEGTVNIQEDRPGRILVETRAPHQRLLVLTERFDPGWHVRSGRRDLTPLRVYGDYLGCVVGEGTQTIEFSFRPQSLPRGVAAGILGAAIILVVGLLSLRRN